MPKYVGKTEDGFVLELSVNECRAIGLEVKYEHRQYLLQSKDDLPNVTDLREMLRKIVRACPELKTARAAMQSFLLLTEPQTVIDAAQNCGTEIRFEKEADEEPECSIEEQIAQLQAEQQRSQQILQTLRDMLAGTSDEA
ncbi:MAG: hypothetical protein E6Q97_09795 [Desulfurellales bacterium]|nr:MAG: hypothetical protein E6Q97_09795 [Desulfurellales bacterium]